MESREDLGREAAAFGNDSVQEVGRFDSSARNRLLGKRNDAAHARRNEDTVPKPVLARAERPSNVANDIGGTRSGRAKARFDAGIVLFD